MFYYVVCHIFRLMIWRAFVHTNFHKLHDFIPTFYCFSPYNTLYELLTATNFIYLLAISSKTVMRVYHLT